MDERRCRDNVIIPETNQSSTHAPIATRKRSNPNENQGEVQCNCETGIIPAWLRAENALRLSYWNNSRGREVLKTCYTVPDSDNELTCFHLTDAKSVFFVRIMCSFFNPQKITIGCHGQNNKKCEFGTEVLGLVISSLTSIVKGSKSKIINLAKSGEKLKMEILNGSLHFSHTFPSDIKKFVQKNNMSAYLSPEDCHFNIPASEIDHLMETLLEASQFLGLKLDTITQRKRVFQTAVHELKQNQSMSSSQFAIKLFEIYYKMDLDPSQRYPISVILPEYYKMFSNVFE